MAVLLIEKAFLVQFSDHWNMDIKPDLHTKRVLYRLGASHAETEDAALEASRRMNPEFPGVVDRGIVSNFRSSPRQGSSATFG